MPAATRVRPSFTWSRPLCASSSLLFSISRVCIAVWYCAQPSSIAACLSQCRLRLRTLVGEFSRTDYTGRDRLPTAIRFEHGRLRRFKLNGRRIELRLESSSVAWPSSSCASASAPSSARIPHAFHRAWPGRLPAGLRCATPSNRRHSRRCDWPLRRLCLVGIACPWQVARAIDRDERFANGIIVSEGRIGNEHEARKTAASSDVEPVGRARVIRRVHKADHRELTLGEAVVQVLRALDKTHLVADITSVCHRVRRKQALVAFRGPGAALQDRPVQIRTVARLHGEAIVARARLGSVNIKRLEAQRILRHQF